jgi:putative transposase
LEVIKTVRVPVHYALTKRKLSILEHLTARLTHCVSLFAKLIEERNMNVSGYGELTRADLTQIKMRTKLGIAYVQQCRDQALWMWRSYLAQHEEWEQKVRHAKGKRVQKFVKREPQKPFRKDSAKKVPVRIDTRAGVVEAAKRIKLSPCVLRLSTLRKGVRVTIPLNPAQYHLALLRKGRAVDFQILKLDGRYYVHICVKYEVPDVPVRAVRGIDLGVRRTIATVLLKPGYPLRREDLFIIKDDSRKHRLDMLKHRTTELQQARKWEPLKRICSKHRNVAKYYDRLDAIRIAELSRKESSMVAVGYPKGLKYDSHRGNGKPALRRLLHERFPYKRRIQYIVEECLERGIRAKPLLEAWTSRRCHRCGSTKTRRVCQSLLWCLDCGLHYNADWNSAINIGSVFLPAALNRKAIEGLACAGDELAQKPASPEAREKEFGQVCQS